jgi:hypothetical protein
MENKVSAHGLASLADVAIETDHRHHPEPELYPDVPLQRGGQG